MGVTTDYLGHIEIVPPLNDSEMAYLHAFARSRRCWRPGGPYEVEPADPPTRNTDIDTERHNSIAEGQPSLWCQWTPCPQGCCLGWDGHEKFYAGTLWMQYLIDHFLRPGALAQSSGRREFADFTFDHRTDGIIVGHQQDNRELFAIRVIDGEVSREVLRRGDPMPWDEPGWWTDLLEEPAPSRSTRRRLGRK